MAVAWIHEEDVYKRQVSTAFVAPVPDVLVTISIVAEDTKDLDFLAAIQSLVTIEWVAGKTE